MTSFKLKALKFNLRANVIRKTLNKAKPTRSELINQIFKYDQDSIYEDEKGRIYIMSTMTPLYDRLIEAGLIDDKYTFLFWIYLPDKLNDTHIYKSRRSRRDRIPYVEELMLFPQIDDTVKLKRWNTSDNISFDFTITSYHEQLNRKVKISPVTMTSKSPLNIGRKAQIKDSFFADIEKGLSEEEEEEPDEE
jgi:hypothetical protein